MSAKKFVLSIYPEAYLKKTFPFATTAEAFYGIFMHPIQGFKRRRRLVGSGGSPKGAWYDARNQIGGRHA